MLKTLLAGMVLGIAAAIAVGGFVAPVDYERIASITRVAPNGGRLENFHVDLPGDRLIAVPSVADAAAALPEGLVLPPDERFADTLVEVFLLRNADNEVIGLASRSAEAASGAVDWLLFLPARGSLFLSADPAEVEGVVSGRIVGGTESLEANVGIFEERRRSLAGASGASGAERIELSTVTRGGA